MRGANSKNPRLVNGATNGSTSRPAPKQEHLPITMAENSGKERNARTVLLPTSASPLRNTAILRTDRGQLFLIPLQGQLVAAASPQSGILLAQNNVPVPNQVTLATPAKYNPEQDDDINDVAVMAGVNMAEEAQNILGLTAENLDTETRSWGKDETFLHAEPLAVKLRAVSEKYGLDDSDPEVRELISHATQERLKDLVEKLSVIAEHRTEPLRNNPFFEQTTDYRAQLRFLEELSKKEYLEKEEREKEAVLKMAKGKPSKNDSVRSLKDRTKELQTAEQAEIRNRDANTAVQLALASKKRPSTVLNDSFTSSPGNASGDARPRTQVSRPRYKRVSLRDLQVLVSRERGMKKSKTLWRLSYFK